MTIYALSDLFHNHVCCLFRHCLLRDSERYREAGGGCLLSGKTCTAMKVIVKPRQTLCDIAMQIYGDLRAVGDLAMANSIPMTADLTPGSYIECPEVSYDKYLQDYVSENKVSPATAYDGSSRLHVGIFTEEFTEEFE